MSIHTAVQEAKKKLGNRPKIMRIEQMPGGYVCDHDNSGDYPAPKGSKHVMKTHHEVAKHVKEHFGNSDNDTRVPVKS